MTAPYVPSFLVPSAPAALSNHLGSNLTNDILKFSVRSQNPLALQDRPAAFRYKSYRTPYGSSARVLASDSFWLGTGNTQPYPPTPGLPTSLYPSKPNNSCVYNGRIYVFAEDNAGAAAVSYNLSAPINGRNIGTWRQELSLPPAFSGGLAVTGGHIQACIALNGFIYVGSTAVDVNGYILVYFAQVLSDGTFGAWSSFTISGYVGISILYGYTDTTGTYFGIRSGAGNWVGATLGADGTPSTAFVQGGNDAVNPRHAGAAITVPSGSNDGKATVLFIGGQNDTTLCFTTVTRAPITAGVSTGVYTNNATAILPAVRSWFGFAVSNGFVYVMGGTAVCATAAPSYANAVGTVYYHDIPGLLADAGAWGTSANSVAVSLGQIAGGDSVLGPLTKNNAATGLPTVAVGFGWNVATTFLTVMMSATCDANTGAPNAFASGGVNQLGSGDLTSGSVVGNQDGSVTIGWAMGSNAYQPAGALTFRYGDVVQVDVFIIDQQGDVAPTGTILFKMGSAPSLSVTPTGTVTDAVVPVLLSYNSFVGDAPQSGWRVQISNYQDVVVAQAPVGYWPMGDQAPQGNNDAADVIAARTAVTSFPGTQTNVDGKIGAAMGLDGTGFFTVTTNPALHPGDTLSLKCWFKTTMTGNGTLIFAGANDYSVDMLGGQLRFLKTGASLIFQSNQTYNDGLWHHLVITKNAGVATVMYVDGQAVAGTFANATLVASANPIIFGATGIPSLWFIGSLQHIAIFNFVLTPAQVLAEFNAATPLFDSGFLAGSGNSLSAFTTPGLANGNYHLIVYGYSSDIPFPATSTGNATSSTALVINASAAGGGSAVTVGANP